MDNFTGNGENTCYQFDFINRVFFLPMTAVVPVAKSGKMLSSKLFRSWDISDRRHLVRIHQPFLKKVLCFVLKIFPYLEAFECNTTSDWLNPMV